MAPLSQEQLHWLRLLGQHRPGKDVRPLPIPTAVRSSLLTRRLAHRRKGDGFEITFEGIQEVRNHRGA